MMQPLSNFYKLLSENEIEILHENVLKLLENPGMKIENHALLEALEKKGASVDFTGEIAKIPKKLIEEVIEIAAYQYNYIKGIGGNHFAESLELIREKGISGLFINTDHTAKNFRDFLTFPKAISSIKSTSVSEALNKDPVELAHKKCLDILSSTKSYQIDEERAKAIDKVVEEASKELSLIKGAIE